MSNKLIETTQLFENTQKDVINSIKNWQEYLTTASRLYKYSFDDQLLIYAQKPNATACANMELWNKKMNRWVKGGSKGIALLRRGYNKKPRLEYVFDIEDTREVNGAKKPYIWEMRKEFETPIIEKLSAMYGEIPTDSDFATSIMEFCARATGENYREFLHDLSYDLDDSFLEGFDELNIDVSFRNALTISTQYMVLTRCGIDPSIYLDEEDFSGITDFNTDVVLTHLGDALNRVSSEVLLAIGDVTRKIEREISETPIAISKKIEYTKDIENFNTLNRESKNIKEEVDNEKQSNLQQERGLSDTQLDTGTRPSTRQSEQIRNAPRYTPTREQERNVSQNVDEQQPMGTSDRDRQHSTGTSGADNGATDGGTGSDRGNESKRSDVVGADGKQHQTPSRGSSSKRTDLQLKEFLAEENAEENLTEVLSYDMHYKNKLEEISAYFSAHFKADDRAEYMKNTINNDYTELLSNGTRLGYKKDETGLKVWRGSLYTPISESHLSWDLVAGFISNMVLPKFIKKQAEQTTQISFFPSVEQQIENIVNAKTEEKQSSVFFSAQNSLLDDETISFDVVDKILATGRDWLPQKNLPIIVGHFSYNRNPSENTEFLKDHYGTGGKGFEIDGQKYSLWYNENGMQIARGTSTRLSSNKINLSWEQVSDKVRNLLEDGNFVSNEVLETSNTTYLHHIAENYAYMYRDRDDDYKNEKLDSIMTHFGFTTCQAVLAEHFTDKAKLANLLEGLEQMEQDYKDTNIHHRTYNPSESLNEIKDFASEPVIFPPAKDDFAMVEPSFITEDEIDNFFIGRNDYVNERKVNTYLYFSQDFNNKSKADFLKNLHGVGGFGGSYGTHSSHNAKGCEFGRGGKENYDKVFWSWGQFSKKIDKYISEKRYLTPKEIAFIPTYERENLATEIYNFYYNAPKDLKKPYEVDVTKYDARDTAIKQILVGLNDDTYMYDLIEQMEYAVSHTLSDERGFSEMERTLKDIKDFQNDEYNVYKTNSYFKSSVVNDDLDEQDSGTIDLSKIAKKLERKRKTPFKENNNGQLSLEFSAPSPVSDILDERGLVVSEELIDYAKEQLDNPTSLEIADKVEAIIAQDEQDTILPVTTITQSELEKEIGTTLYNFSQKEIELYTGETGKRYVISTGHFGIGNGLTVFNVLDKKNDGVNTDIAFIDADRNIKYFDENLPKELISAIENIALTDDRYISKDKPMFNIPSIEINKKNDIVPVRQIMYSDIASEYTKSFPNFQDFEMSLYTSEKGKKYVIGSGHFGNGLSVWNYLDEEHGDYTKLAHISTDREITFYDKKLPVGAVAEIEDLALNDNRNISSSQKISVFRNSPADKDIQIDIVPVRQIMYSDIASEFVKSSRDFKDHEMNVYTNDDGKEFAFGYGKLGNGTTVWNYLEERNGDYVTIAHIEDDGTFTIRDKTMPDLAIKKIEESAKKFYPQKENIARIIELNGNYNFNALKTEFEARDKIADLPINASFAKYSSRQLKLALDEIEKQGQIQGSPYWQAYTQFKEQYPDDIVLYQLGDFFEAFDDDAKTTATQLEFALISRDVKLPERVPMCGIPRHILDDKIKVLQAKGHNVTVAKLENGKREPVRYMADIPPVVEPKIALEETPVAEKTPIDLYREYLPIVQKALDGTISDFYIKGAKPNKVVALNETALQIARQIDGWAKDSPAFLQAYNDLPLFREYFNEDVYYQKYENRTFDLIKNSQVNENLPSWTQEKTEPKKAKLEPRVTDGKMEKLIQGEQSVIKFLEMKAEHPRHVIGVQGGELLFFYGEDAEIVAPAIGRKILERDLPELGHTKITGNYASQWEVIAKKLRLKGISFKLIGTVESLDPQLVDRLKLTDNFHLINEHNAEDFLPIGMEIDIEGRKFSIERVNYDNDSVSLRDVTFQNSTGYPILRSESVEYVRSYVEDKLDRDFDLIVKQEESQNRVNQMLEVAEIAYKESQAELGIADTSDKQQLSETLFNSFEQNKMDKWQDSHAKQMMVRGIIRNAVEDDDIETQRIFDNILRNEPKSAKELYDRCFNGLNYQIGDNIEIQIGENNPLMVVITAIDTKVHYYHKAMPTLTNLLPLDIFDNHFENWKVKIDDIHTVLSEPLFNAYKSSKMAEWQTNDVKQNRIKKALHNVLGDKTETERIFTLFLRFEPKTAEELQTYMSCAFDYKVSDHVNIDFEDATSSEVIITKISDNYIWYQFTDIEQEPVLIHRDDFDKYLAFGNFEIIFEQPTLEKEPPKIAEPTNDYDFAVGDTIYLENETFFVSSISVANIEKGENEDSVRVILIDKDNKSNMVTPAFISQLMEKEKERLKSEQPIITKVAETLEPTTEKPTKPTPPKIRFFKDFKDIARDIDYSKYKDQDIIGYNEKGVKYTVGKSGNTTYTTTTTSITPYGDVLGTEMSPEVHNDFIDWKNSKKQEKNEDANGQTNFDFDGGSIENNAPTQAKQKEPLVNENLTNRLIKQMKLVEENSNFKPFYDDVLTWSDFRSGDNIVGHTVVDWIVDICAMSEDELNEFVTNYETDSLNANSLFKAHYDKVNAPKTNFTISNDELGTGGLKEKFVRNILAITTLQTLEKENRNATAEEQETLSQYVGWGGMPDAFDDSKTAWSKEYAQLKGLLTESEYKSARSSTKNAHYTTPTVIRSMYDALNDMGVPTNGNFLDPALGSGNFFGVLPDNLKGSKLYGSELDSLTGRIATLLYPNADIQIKGFEKTTFPDSFFDVAVGNVPFGNYKVNDKRYDKQNFMIHDYFFAKTLDKVRTGGIVAFITSKGTLDKENSSVREYLASKADLLGAIRLPKTAFKANANTEVTSDIIFLQKRDHAPEVLPSWVKVNEQSDGIYMNQYFIDNPHMVMGKMAMQTGQFGMESTCLPNLETSLAEQLKIANTFLIPPDKETLKHRVVTNDVENEIETSLAATPDVKNFSYTMVDDKLYYRQNSRMHLTEVSDNDFVRINALIGIRDCTREIIQMQLDECTDEELQKAQFTMNTLFDKYNKKYGLIGSRASKRVFLNDVSYPLLCSLEKIDEDGKLCGKADMFTKRTIKNTVKITSVDTPSESLAVSISEKACVDIPFMAHLLGGLDKIDTVIDDLKGVIFKDPLSDKEDKLAGWQPADEYLSGNVRDKLIIAKLAFETNPDYATNVEMLTKVQPKDLLASEIDVRVGATWVDPKYYSQFIFELLGTPKYLQGDKIDVKYSKHSGEWNVTGKSEDRGNPKSNATYGTSRKSAYQIIEDSLNLRDTRVYDPNPDSEGPKYILNPKETQLAQGKQEAIGETFKEWVWKDPQRREDLSKKYNEIYNATRPREFDGQHIKFDGMSPFIKLNTHQINAVARTLYGGNTLLAHCVGAGKTYEMIASAMEGKRLGLNQKSLFVVPNHLTEQMGADIYELYPGAKVLVATKKDFEPANRKEFCSRIATGDFDIVVLGHTQFEKIPLSVARQEVILEAQISDIMLALQDAKAQHGERYTIKQLENTEIKLRNRLEKLASAERKDSVVTFEELGVDKLFIDEAHLFKNLFLQTKMRNVAGIGQSEAQKSTDMFTKCRYMDEITGGKGIVFATGTPVSNSMTELYTMMRYLQYSTLERLDLIHFDSWAANFGEKITAIELSPEGTGFRMKTRFAKFFNLPELINIWKECADIQTADMLNLKVPTAEDITVVTKPSEFQTVMVKDLAKRAKWVRKNPSKNKIDNMLKITSDGRKLALDQRLGNDMLPDNPDSKINKCIENVMEIWENTSDIKGSQLIFSDMSTPHYDGSFNVYDDIKNKLMEQGIPQEEIAFIHDGATRSYI